MIVRSSHGDLTIDTNTGKIIDAYYFDDSDKDNYLKNIQLFNVLEFKRYYGEFPAEIDILDIGDWNKAGEYTKPSKEYRS